MDFDRYECEYLCKSQCKKRRICNSSAEMVSAKEPFFPTLDSSGYYMKPCLEELIAMENLDPGYCSRVSNFVVGRFGYGFVKFLGETDVRWLDLDRIIQFGRHEVIVYDEEDESCEKPVVGTGLNKTAEVTLFLQRSIDFGETRVDWITRKLKKYAEKQGARFLSFDPCTGEWKFLVDHFSRFGLSDDDEEDLVMDDVPAIHQYEKEMNGGEDSDLDGQSPLDTKGPLLSHSLPAHLGLDPVKMREMKLLMFPVEEGDDEHFEEFSSYQKHSSDKDDIRNSLQNITRSINYRSSPPVVRKTPLALLKYNPDSFESRSPGTILMTQDRSSPPVVRKTPLALLEYNPNSFESRSPGTILMTQENKALPLKTTKMEGFRLNLKDETLINNGHSRNVVDAGLFMGRSFRVGWGPNGILVHTGALVRGNDSQKVLSSVINIEKVAIDQALRDENNKLREEFVEASFDSPLQLHKEIDHVTEEVEVGSFKLKLQKLVSDRVSLSQICRSYIGIIEKKLEVPGLSSSTQRVLMHQVMVWELIKVLFSDKELGGPSKLVEADNEEDMMHDTKEGSPEVDPEALPLVRRAEFSYWLQESVHHRVENEVSLLNESRDLEHIFLLLSGRQLDKAVELAASAGDVRLACLLSQAGGSMVNRSDVAEQLKLWKQNGLDFSFIEKDRVRLYMLLAGDIHGCLNDRNIDWKRFLGLLMWYHLPPTTALSDMFYTYHGLLDEGGAPDPVPVYIDEGPEEESVSLSHRKHFDLAYYLMLLHANGENEFGLLKTMFSAFSSTPDPLDYHMIWHQRAVLEAVGACSCNDLHILDMSHVSQLLCLGQCHWAIYVALHMFHRADYPYLQANLIREILFQYCECWSSQEVQRQFIMDLGIPSEWLHEAMAVYSNYYGNLPEALENFLKCANWQKAHSIFVTSVSHSLYLSGKESEIWRLASSLEDHKAEIANWELGAGVYISFYQLRSSLQEDDSMMSELDSLDDKNAACRDFFSCLNESLVVWGSRLPLPGRVAYSMMAEEICSLLSSNSAEEATPEVLLSCFDTMVSAPIPEDGRSCHLQDAISHFTSFLSEVAS